MPSLPSAWMKTRRGVESLGGAAGRLSATLAKSDEREGALGRHGTLLFSLIVLLVGLPIGEAIFGIPTRFPLLLTLVLISAVVVNSHQRWIFLVACLIGFGAVAGLGYAEYFDSRSARFVGTSFGLALLGFTTLVMLNSLIRTNRVSQDTIIGGICVYLMVGLCYTMVFILLTSLSPGTFSEGGHGIVRSTTDSSAHATTLLYFSFVTLTTLGFGDVVPHGELARMFTVTEAVIGQLYLAIFLARLVSLYLISVRDDPS